MCFPSALNNRASLGAGSLRLEVGAGGLPAGQDPDSGRAGVGADRHPQDGGQLAGHRHAAPGPGGLDRPEGQQLAFGGLPLSGREAAAGEPGALPHEGLGTDAEAPGGQISAPLPDAAYLCHLGDFGGGEHQLGGPDVGAPEPGNDPGEEQSLCAESDPVGWQGVAGGRSNRGTFPGGKAD